MLRPVVILGVTALLAVVGGREAGSAAGGRAAADLTFSPSADAYVTRAAPRRNFGRAKVLRARSRPQTRSYLRFDLAGIDGPVTRASLRLYSRAGSRFAVRSTSSGWSERTIRFGNAPRLGRVIAGPRRVRARRWVSIDVTRAVRENGAVSLALTGSATLASREAGSRKPQLVVRADPPPTLLAAGDIAECDSPWDEATAAVVSKVPGTVAAVGDLAYESGTLDEFNRCYQPSWGAFKARTKPAPGNHEYRTPNAAGYFAYWGAAAGNPAQGWYSYDLGTWHVVSLNSNCGFVGGCFAGSPQERWLRADLAAHRTSCTLAYWHHPLFSATSGTAESDVTRLWQALYEANAELVLSGHAHNYQRFAPQNTAGAADPARGIREFVVGTGGSSFHALSGASNVEVSNASTWGVLDLTLRNGGYDWRFLPVAGQTFTDSGSQACH